VIIAPDVERVARRFGTPERLLAAVDRAEGDLIAAVRCTVAGVQTRDEALEVTARSANHMLWDFLHEQGLERAFVERWARRWAPADAPNDPTGLNANWPKNVTQLWGV
jgi:hypothetical protein